MEAWLQLFPENTEQSDNEMSSTTGCFAQRLENMKDSLQSDAYFSLLIPTV